MIFLVFFHLRIHRLDHQAYSMQSVSIFKSVCKLVIDIVSLIACEPDKIKTLKMQNETLIRYDI